MTKTLTITEARNTLPTLVDRARRLMDEYVITVKGKPTAVIMSAEQYESWKETNEILADKVLMRSIRKGEEDFKRGKYITLEEFEKKFKRNV